MKHQSDPSNVESDMQVDYQALQYVNEVDHNLLCPICYNPMLDAHFISCRHSFCSACIDTYWDTLPPESLVPCPVCRSTLSPEGLPRPVPLCLTNTLDELVVRCPLEKEGCFEQMPRDQVSAHVKHRCSYASVACPSRVCGLRVQRRHASMECAHIYTHCSECQLGLMEMDLQAHKDNDCLLREVTCSRCNSTYIDFEAREHQAECPGEMVHCTARGVGCSVTVPRKDMADHEAQCPLAALQPKFRAMTNLLRMQGTNIRQLVSRLGDQSDRLDSLLKIAKYDDGSAASRSSPGETVASPLSPSRNAPYTVPRRASDSEMVGHTEESEQVSPLMPLESEAGSASSRESSPGTVQSSLPDLENPLSFLTNPPLDPEYLRNIDNVDAMLREDADRSTPRSSAHLVETTRAHFAAETMRMNEEAEAETNLMRTQSESHSSDNANDTVGHTRDSEEDINFPFEAMRRIRDAIDAWDKAVYGSEEQADWSNEVMRRIREAIEAPETRNN